MRRVGQSPKNRESPHYLPIGTAGKIEATFRIFESTPDDSVQTRLELDLTKKLQLFRSFVLCEY